MTIEIKPYTYLRDVGNRFDLLIYRVQSATALIATDVYNSISGNWKDDCFYHYLRVVPKCRDERIKAYRKAVATEVWKRKKAL
jgi:hypothetical protein